MAMVTALFHGCDSHLREHLLKMGVQLSDSGFVMYMLALMGAIGDPRLRVHVGAQYWQATDVRPATSHPVILVNIGSRRTVDGVWTHYRVPTGHKASKQTSADVEYLT
ncbi:hypothetical protein WJX72_011638 [[Myrmecia] bisecta]|uniref:Uncharacterized protein n=1 Tax=[Myrmecia] bisecta TaxID=41462 RepID=A0AAW1Q4Y2_9CHLO